MGFTTTDIHPPMDVYTLDNVYLGTVLRVLPGPHGGGREAVAEEARQSGTTNGELLGPMPTQDIGNTGPATQSARAGYATGSGAAAPLDGAAFQVGKWWGLVGRRTIPLALVQTVSLERVLLSVRHADLDG